MMTDLLCTTSWTARPRTFVGLMTLYESNFIRLHWLVADVRQLAPVSVSVVAGDCALELKVIDRGPYTTMLSLSYVFGDMASGDREPSLQIRVYHDARLAEATALASGRQPGVWRNLIARVQSVSDACWARNMLLNKWLEYCAAMGHRFSRTSMASPPAPA